MINKASHLITESVKALREGGFKLLFQRMGSYINWETNHLFNPKVPPILIKYKDLSVDLGYRRKYLYSFRAPSDLLINPSDTVVETGVYHGKDTAGYAKLGKRVIGFEPSPRNYAIAKENLKDFKNVELLNEGLWNDQSELTIRYGEDGSEDGFLQPDAGEEEVEYNIPVNTLENYVKRLNVDEVNFLKIEAEGAEPEVIEGMGDIRPDRIAVDVSAERDGEPTTKPVMELLHSMGYGLHGVNSGYVLIFIHKESDKHTFNNIFD